MYTHRDLEHVNVLFYPASPDLPTIQQSVLRKLVRNGKKQEESRVSSSCRSQDDMHTRVGVDDIAHLTGLKGVRRFL